MNYFDILNIIDSKQQDVGDDVISILQLQQILDKENIEFESKRDQLLKMLEDAMGGDMFRVEYDRKNKVLIVNISPRYVLSKGYTVTFKREDDDLVIIDSDYNDNQELLERSGDFLCALCDLYANSEYYNMDLRTVHCVEDSNIRISTSSYSGTLISLYDRTIFKVGGSNKYSYLGIKSKKELDFINDHIDYMLEHLHVPLSLMPKFVQDAVNSEKEESKDELRDTKVRSKRIGRINIFKKHDKTDNS